MPVSPTLTVKDVARLLRVDEKTVYRLSQRKVLPGFKVAGAWRFRRDDLDAWIEAQKAVRPKHGVENDS
jgi:excisionase family DNA binding protein